MSTAFSGEFVIASTDDGGMGNGTEVGCVLELGAVPRESAAITS